MAQVNLWLSEQDLARRLSTTTGELYYYRKHRQQHLREQDRCKNGKVRHFVVPNESYKDLLRRVDRQLKRFLLPTYFYGSQGGKSAVDCALVHLNSDYILKLDLKNFFPSTSYHRVREALAVLCTNADVRTLVTELCTYNHQLPQGFPTSPSIAEIVLLPLARRIHGLCLSRGFKLSIYIDDVIISGGATLTHYEERFRGLFAEMKFQLNDKKSHLFSSSEGCAVTGVWLQGGSAATTPKFDKREALLRSMLKAKGSTAFDDRLRRQLLGKLAWRKHISSKLLSHGGRNGAAVN